MKVTLPQIEIAVVVVCCGCSVQSPTICVSSEIETPLSFNMKKRRLHTELERKLVQLVGDIDVVVSVDNLVGDVVEHASRDVDESKCCFHAF